MNVQSEVYITVLKGKNRLVITGGLSLLKEFVGIFQSAATIYNPAEADEITAKTEGEKNHERTDK